MNNRLPPLDALRAFEAAARHLSFTRAAEQLFITQSAVSKQVQALESALAVRLFERKTRALLLTAAGERLQRAVAAAFAELRAATADLSGGDEPTVTLATTQAFASFWLIPRLAEFRRRHPGVDIRISADTRMVDLERGGFDCAVRYLQDRQAPAGALRLFGESVLPVASPAYLKKSGRPLDKPADLAHHLLLVYEDDEQRRPWLSWPVWLEMAGQPRLQSLCGRHQRGGGWPGRGAGHPGAGGRPAARRSAGGPPAAAFRQSARLLPGAGDAGDGQPRLRGFSGMAGGPGGNHGCRH